MPLHYNQNTNNPNYVPYNPHDPNHNGNPNNNNHIHQNHQHVHPYPAQNIHPQQQQQQQQQQQHPNFGGAQQFQPKGGNNSTHQNHQFNPSNSGSQASSTNDLSQFFRSRQMDLYKHISFDDSNSRINIAGRCTSKIRNHIMETYHLKESQFPVLHDLNHYLQLYEIEFNKYFPFIHIPSLNVDDNLDQIPLLLSMSAIGALYSFHARNSSTLFNFSRFLIHNYMENQMSNNLANVTDVPLHITQSLLLHMFLGMFHNDIEVTKLTQRQLASLVALVKSTNLDKPLDSFIMPPNINETLNLESENLKACHDYFIFAQSRIRTIHCLHYLCVLFGIIVDIPILLNADEIKCGNIIYKESIWSCKNGTEWIDVLNSEKVQINSKLTLIQLSNGNLSYITLWNDLYNHTLNSKENIGFRSLLSLLLSLNGLVHQTRLSLEGSSQSVGSKVAKWRMDLRPSIEELMKTWESCFIKNGGIVVPKGQNLHLINSNPVLKLILPLLSFAKITKCVYISPLLQKVWSRDWNGMNQEMKILDSDPEALRESISHCLDIINLWIDTISIVSDAEKTSVRTPIFFLTCLFASSLIISEYLYATENWAQNYLKNQNQNNTNLLTTADRVLWLRTETILKKVEKNLLPQGSNNFSYSEFLRIQAKGALDVEILDDEIARLALEPGDFTPIAQIITKGRLSNRCLSLGVRMLADAPVWPIALVFAEALKIRATEIHAAQNKFA
ncbi:unnamed protein product [[Candida] boidinii]|nr:unnamed protein product [[Candida] boidinii]